MAGRRIEPRVAAGVLALLAIALTWVGTSWALESADGVSVEVGGPGEDPSTYHVEFMDNLIYVLAAVVGVALVGLAALIRWQLAIVGLVGVAIALLWGGRVCVGRYQESVWSDGLEVFVYAVPLGATVIGSGLIVLGWARRR